MQLKQLIKEVPSLVVKGKKEIAITGISSDSRVVFPGNLFIAKKGGTTDGSYYLGDAINSGAVALLTDMYDPTFSQVTQLITGDIKAAEAALASAYYQFPSKKLFSVGVTGTNGKTTVSYIIKALLDHFQGPSGLIGTVEYYTGGRTLPATHTTPPVTVTQKMLKEMVDHSCQSFVMEVSSHALDQGRVAGIDFDVAIFTNLTQDHLDYHKTMEEYCHAKSKLFSSMTPQLKQGIAKSKVALVNSDDPYQELLTQECIVPIMTYGIESPADLRAKEIQFSKEGTTFTLLYQGKQYPCQTPFIGRYNVNNVLAAMGVLLSQEYPVEEIIKKLPNLPSVPGRMERVNNALGLQVIVDFAHTEDALRKTLSTLRELNPKRLITLFGCGGDRDKGKRPQMANASEKYSNLTIVTSDNPRTEDPEKIIEEIVAGFSHPDNFIREVDRKKAIQLAIDHATPEDIVLIAGRGHESVQYLKHKQLEFRDTEVVNCYLKEKEQSLDHQC